MNEQHFDALPPVNSNQPASQTATGQGGEGAVNANGGQPVPSIGMPAVAPMVDPAGGAAASTALPLTVPEMADDVDLIEKEWVQKAKQIVEQTKNDPYQQNEAVTKIKTDYLKKRYNREIKVPEA